MSSTKASPGAEERVAWRIRAARASDAPFLELLAARLAIGIPTWRDEAAMTATARGWLLHDLARVGEDAAVFLADTDDETPIGAVAVAHGQHFTGSPQAEIGELAVIAEWEGRGVAAALLDAAEAWARAAGLPFVSLATGAANTRALAFYARHGYQQEDIRLTKSLNG